MLRRSTSEIECVVSGGSMGAAIPDGSRVRIRLDGAAGAPPMTAVALLLAGDTFSIHRLVARGRSARARDFVVTHGDGNVFCDAPQRAADLLGIVIAVRGAAEPEWRPVPPPQPGGRLSSAITVAFERLMRGALELSPALGIAIKNLLVLVVTPFVWMRPYPAGHGRSTSRLADARPLTPT